MENWNEQVSDKNNLSSATIKSSKLFNKKVEHEFSEELSDGGERNKIIKNQANNKNGKTV